MKRLSQYILAPQDMTFPADSRPGPPVSYPPGSQLSCGNRDISNSGINPQKERVLFPGPEAVSMADLGSLTV